MKKQFKYPEAPIGERPVGAEVEQPPASEFPSLKKKRQSPNASDKQKLNKFADVIGERDNIIYNNKLGVSKMIVIGNMLFNYPKQPATFPCSIPLHWILDDNWKVIKKKSKVVCEATIDKEELRKAWKSWDKKLKRLRKGCVTFETIDKARAIIFKELERRGL